MPYTNETKQIYIVLSQTGTFVSKVMVLSLDVDTEKYAAITELMKSMLAEKEKYRYNYLGLGFAAFKIRLSFKNRYYCSEFLKEVLQRFGIKGAGELAAIPHPVHFMNIPYSRLIYTGKLCDYRLPAACAQNN